MITSKITGTKSRRKKKEEKIRAPNCICIFPPDSFDVLIFHNNKNLRFSSDFFYCFNALWVNYCNWSKTSSENVCINRKSLRKAFLHNGQSCANTNKFIDVYIATMNLQMLFPVLRFAKHIIHTKYVNLLENCEKRINAVLFLYLMAIGRWNFLYSNGQ